MLVIMSEILDGDMNNCYSNGVRRIFFWFYAKVLRGAIYTDHKHNITMRICIILIKLYT